MSFFFLSLFFFASFVVRGFCRSGCRQNYHLTTPPSPLPPSLPIIFFCPYPQFSLWYMWRLFEISARLKLVSVPFSSLLLDIGHLQKRFPGEHHESSEMGQSYYVSQSLHRPLNIVLYSRFIWLHGSVILIRAETERYDIVPFSMVTTKSLASGTGWTLQCCLNSPG